ncbi:MAG: methyltransferase domain-containing protein [Candidatus Binataceae bacterium]
MTAVQTSARTWTPDVYLAFAGYRARPVEDLLGRVRLQTPGTIYDLGCGPGNVTLMLAERWPEREIIGVDSSPPMLAQARRLEGARVRWQEGDIATWQSAGAALVFSNAALHWVPDHARLLPRLAGALAQGGVLAAQMPNTGDAPYKLLAREVAASAQWRDSFAAVTSQPDPLPAPAYYALLSGHFADIDIWETHYHHVLPDLDAVVKWVSGAALVPYLSVLEESEKLRFLSDYKQAASATYRPQSDGNIVFTMRRIFFVGRRP